MQDTAGGATGPAHDAVLVVPWRLQVHPATADRLRRRLAAADPDIVGVVAPHGTLPPGSSLTTAAERAALAVPVPSPSTDGPRVGADVIGAVLLRHPVPHEVLDDRIRFLPGPGGDAAEPVLETDSGAVALATEPDAPLEPASPSGVPPFRWRPVVLFLAGEDDPARAALAQHHAEALLDHDVEARLAVHAAPPGPARTRPCLPVEASVRALVPDCIVALDPLARDRAHQWSRGVRHTVVIDLDPDLAGDRYELIPWTIGLAQGRRRARVGADLTPATFAALVNRLCSGPQPEAPSDPSDPGSGVEPSPSGAVPVAISGRVPSDPPPTPSRRVWVHRSADASGPLLAGLVDHLAAAGHEVIEPGPEAPAPAIETGDLVLVDSRSTAPSTVGAPVVVLDVVGTTERADEHDRRWDDRSGLTPNRAVTPLAGVIVASGARGPSGADGVDGDVARLALPILPTRSRVQALRAAGERRLPPAAPILGWTAAVIDAVRRLLDQHRDLHVDIVAASADARAAFAGHPRVALRPGAPDPDALATWFAQIWTPAQAGPAAVGDDRPVTDAALAGVPTVLDRADGLRAGGIADRELAVDPPTDPDGWAQLVERLLDDATHAAASERARNRGLALASGDAPLLTIGRLIGWYDAVSAR